MTAGVLLAALQAQAQTAPGAPAQTLPPTDPLPNLPGFEVGWPSFEEEPLPTPAPAPGTVQAQPAETPPDDVNGRPLRYDVILTGLDKIGLAARFRELSELEKGEGGAATSGAIDSRTQADVAIIEQLLHSEGYYAGEVDYDYEGVPGEPGRSIVRIEVTPGPRYTFSDIRLVVPPGGPEALVRDNFELKVGEPIVAQRVEAAEDRLRLLLPQSGYPFARLGVRDMLLDDDMHSGIYTLPVTPGERSRFGGFRQEGDRLFGPDHLAVLARFESGELYDIREVEDLRQAMIATGLFSSVAIRPVRTDRRTPEGDSVVDLLVRGEAGPQRTLAGSVGYGTGEGVKVEGLWRHRNLFPPEGSLTGRVVAGTREQRLGGEFRRNNFRRRDQVLSFLAEISREDVAAYNAQVINLAGRIERLTNLVWQKKWIYSFGAELQASRERDSGNRQTYFVAALPAQVGYDGSDDLLDPTTGFRLSGRLSPEAAHQNGVFTYARAQIDGSAYMPLGSENFVLAGRVRVGSIVGADRDRIAPTRRFYVGGGGSVRGFGYQSIGPRDEDGDPLGGKSLIETSIELRYRFGNFGIVPFIDAGQLYQKTLPNFSDWRIGAGIGGRYYTGFGPIRIDVATPLNPRSGDPKIALYVSIGQAF